MSALSLIRDVIQAVREYAQNPTALERELASVEDAVTKEIDKLEGKTTDTTVEAPVLAPAAMETEEALEAPAPVTLPDVPAAAPGVTLGSLPTEDPKIAGVLWNNAGNITVSNG